MPVGTVDDTSLRCIRALLACDPAPDEIILVMDGITAPTASELSNETVHVIALPDRMGPAVARNRGAATAKGHVLFFVDADVLVPACVIRQIYDTFTTKSQLSAFFGSYDDLPAATNHVSRYKNLLQHYVHQVARDEAATFWSACGVIYRKAFLSVGGFDERYLKPSIEDIELGYRLRAAGHCIFLNKLFFVKHLKRWTLTSLLQSDVFRRAIPWTELILRDSNFVNDLNTSRSSRIKVVLIYLIVLLVPAAVVMPTLLGVALVLLGIMIYMDRRLYGFFKRQQGIMFAISCIPIHSFYYFYSGLAFVIGTVRYFFLKPPNGTGSPVCETGVEPPELAEPDGA